MPSPLTDPALPEFTAQEFKKLDLRASLVSEKRFNNCTFVKCAFPEITFRFCAFHECTFTGCDLSLAKFPSTSFTGCKMDNCRLDGVNWTKSGWAGKVILKPLDFTGCVLNFNTFMGMNLKGVALRKCVAREVSFEEADLTRADCRGTDFSGSRFVHTNLTEADFTGASNYTIPPLLNTLKKTKFALPEAMSLLRNLDIVLSDEFGEEEGVH